MIISRLLSPTKQSHQLPLQEIKKSPVQSGLFQLLVEGKNGWEKSHKDIENILSSERRRWRGWQVFKADNIGSSWVRTRIYWWDVLCKLWYLLSDLAAVWTRRTHIPYSDPYEHSFKVADRTSYKFYTFISVLFTEFIFNNSNWEPLLVVEGAV